MPSLASSATLLSGLSRDLMLAPWTPFSSARDVQLTAHTKIADGADGLAVIKIEAEVRAPVFEVTRLFRSPEAAQWNTHIASIDHLGGGMQLQTYSSPWPFAWREYLVHCEDEDLEGGGHASHCRSSEEGHPAAPLRDDRVRGTSETLWRIAPSKEAPQHSTTIHVESLVDPGGGVPKWLVNEVGKRASVTMVTSFIRKAEMRAETARDGIGCALPELAAAARNVSPSCADNKMKQP